MWSLTQMFTSQRCYGPEFPTDYFGWAKRMIVTTPAIMEGLREALSRPKFRLRIRTLQSSVSELMEALLSIVEVVEDMPIGAVIKRDPDDDKILACAKVAQAGWIVSGDDHLLSLRRYKGIPIVTPRQFSRAWGKAQ